MDIENSNNCLEKRNWREKLLYIAKHKKYHGKGFNCVTGFELSQSQSTSKNMFALKFGFILVVYCGGTVLYLLAKDISAFIRGPTSVRNQS